VRARALTAVAEEWAVAPAFRLTVAGCRYSALNGGFRCRSIHRTCTTRYGRRWVRRLFGALRSCRRTRICTGITRIGHAAPGRDVQPTRAGSADRGRGTSRVRSLRNGRIFDTALVLITGGRPLTVSALRQAQDDREIDKFRNIGSGKLQDGAVFGYGTT